jgi:hypothetical protein
MEWSWRQSTHIECKINHCGNLSTWYSHCWVSGDIRSFPFQDVHSDEQKTGKDPFMILQYQFVHITIHGRMCVILISLFHLDFLDQMYSETPQFVTNTVILAAFISPNITVTITILHYSLHYSQSPTDLLIVWNNHVYMYCWKMDFRQRQTMSPQ